jgi:hypothetical protein
MHGPAPRARPRGRPRPVPFLSTRARLHTRRSHERAPPPGKPAAAAGFAWAPAPGQVWAPQWEGRVGSGACRRGEPARRIGAGGARHNRGGPKSGMAPALAAGRTRRRVGKAGGGGGGAASAAGVGMGRHDGLMPCAGLGAGFNGPSRIWAGPQRRGTPNMGGCCRMRAWPGLHRAAGARRAGHVLWGSCVALRCGREGSWGVVLLLRVGSGAVRVAAAACATAMRRLPSPPVQGAGG